MMGLQIQLILTVLCVVSNCGLTSVQLYDQKMVRQAVISATNDEIEIREHLQNLFDSIAKNNTKKGETYREILKQEVVREQQAFDGMKEELWIARNRNAYKKIHFYKNSNTGEHFMAAKRETKKNNHGTILLQKLNSLNKDTIQKIEDFLNRTTTEIRDILNDGSDAAFKEVTMKLNHLLVDLLVNATTEKDKIIDFVNTFLVPNQAPSHFLCAWMMMVEFLEQVFQKGRLYELIPSLDEIVEFADVATRGISVSHSKKTLARRSITKYEFIAVVEMLGPELNRTLIEEVADHATGTDFGFTKYYERVLKGFVAWITFLREGDDIFRDTIVSELKIMYQENWVVGAQILALLGARDHVVGNSVRYDFWKVYQVELAQERDKDFEDILDSHYSNGWYFTNESVNSFHLLVRAVRRIDISQMKLELEFEPFPEKQSVGIPQSSFCKSSKRDFHHYYRRWSTTSTPE